MTKSIPENNLLKMGIEVLFRELGECEDRYPNGHPEGAPFEHYGPLQSKEALCYAGKHVQSRLVRETSNFQFQISNEPTTSKVEWNSEEEKFFFYPVHPVKSCLNIEFTTETRRL